MDEILYRYISLIIYGFLLIHETEILELLTDIIYVKFNDNNLIEHFVNENNYWTF